jgi:sec-independent protein translocase protein TatA
MLLPGIGLPELLLIVLIVLLIFGGRKIPELMRSMGEGIREFKKASKGLSEDTSPPPREKTETEKLREAAAALGVSTEGKSDEDIRKEVSDKVAS